MSRPSFHTKHFIFTPKDLAAYSNELVREFPQIRFYEWPTEREQNSENPSPPHVRFRSSLDACDRYASIVFDPTWTPKWEPPGRVDWWYLENSPLPNGEVEPGGFFTNRDGSLRLSGGRIYIRCAPGDKKHASLARKALRLIEKVATNRCQSLRYPSFEIVWRAEKGHNEWIGHDAARWAREAPDRLLDYKDYLKSGLRPLD
jgi:hypothetical protein